MTNQMTKTYPPNHAQLSTAVKGDDRYRPGLSLLAIVLKVLLVIGFVALWFFVFFVGLTGRG